MRNDPSAGGLLNVGERGKGVGGDLAILTLLVSLLRLMERILLDGLASLGNELVPKAVPRREMPSLAFQGGETLMPGGLIRITFNGDRKWQVHVYVA